MGSRQEFFVNPVQDTDGIAESQTPASGGVQSLVLNGALIVGGVFDIETPHLIQITSVADETARTFTVIGLDDRGQSVQDSFLGANAGVASSTKYFTKVTQITVDNDTTGAVFAGIDGRSCSNWMVINHGSHPLDIGFGVFLSSGANLTYSVEHTFDDIQQLGDPLIETLEHIDVRDKTINDDGNYAFPPVACRAIVKAFTLGSLRAIFIQSF